MLTIRDATTNDVSAIRNLYNALVSTTPGKHSLCPTE
jgi:L-amino acid N-acyltransferase YncA